MSQAAKHDRTKQYPTSNGVSAAKMLSQPSERSLIVYLEMAASALADGTIFAGARRLGFA